MADEGKWLKFNLTWTFVPDEDRRTSVQYLAGKTYRVRGQCARKALAAGVADVAGPPQGSKVDARQSEDPELRELDKAHEFIAGLGTPRADEGGRD